MNLHDTFNEPIRIFIDEIVMDDCDIETSGTCMSIAVDFDNDICCDGTCQIHLRARSALAKHPIELTHY